ncbi:MAG: polysaccharide biosynthesis tyrosine autokinase [Pseudomonadota bacterium]
MSKTISFELPRSDGTGAPAIGGDLPIDLRSLVNMVFKRFWLISITAGLVFLAVAYATFTQTPIYQARATVIVDSSQRNVIDLGAVLAGGALTTSVINTEVEVMQSKRLLRRVAIEHNLIADPEFNPTLRPAETGPLSTLSGIVSSAIDQVIGGDEDDFIDTRSEAEREADLLDWVVYILGSKVHVSRHGTTYLITTQVTSESPETAALLANAIADQYRVEQMEAKLEATQRATAWLSERVAVLREEVEERELAVETFSRQNGLLSAEGNPLTESAISDLQGQQIQLQGELTRVRARYDGMRRQMIGPGGVNAVAEVLNSPVISNLKDDRAEAQSRVAEFETSLGPLHPSLVAARSEVADLDRQIAAEVARVVSNVEAEVRVAEDQLATVNSRLGAARARLVTENTAQIRLRELERDAEASRAIYQEFIERFKETREQNDLVEADARVLSKANVPSSPAAPRVELNLVLGLLLGGALGFALALLIEIFDGRISSIEDLEHRLSLPSVGSIPVISRFGFLGFGKLSPADYLVENPLSAFTESIRYLRAAITFSDIDNRTKTVAVTSSLPDEGKTSVTLSLGRMSALSGSKTLIIDGDFRRRQLTEAAGVRTDFGLVEHLITPGALENLVQHDEKSGADILPLSLNGHSPHDVFGTHAFDELHKQLREKYDLILIDTGPLLLMAEARVIAGKADKTIMITRWRKTTRAAARKSVKLLETFHADLLGVVLNMVDVEQRRHHNEPGTNYRDYKKYYMTEGKRRLWGNRKKSKTDVGTIPAAATTAPTADTDTSPKVATLKPIAASRDEVSTAPDTRDPNLGGFKSKV